MKKDPHKHNLLYSYKMYVLIALEQLYTFVFFCHYWEADQSYRGHLETGQGISGNQARYSRRWDKNNNTQMTEQSKMCRMPHVAGYPNHSAPWKSHIAEWVG